ncbi:MAG TPA: type II secretion system F family protein, partial [Acetobacteraceae bacterium]
MPTFRYRAIGPTGDVQTGMMDAATEAEVVARLQRQGAMPMRAEPANSESWVTALWHAEFTTRKGLRRQETADFIRELATMLSAGQDLDRALLYMYETASNARVRTMTAGLRDIVRDGGPLADALGRYPRAFSRLHVAMVSAGEASGQLAPTLARLADLLERQQRLAASVTSALIYPCLLTIVAIGSIALLLTEVLPQFVPLFEQSGAKLPASTQLLIVTGAFVTQYGVFMLLGLAVMVLVARAALRLTRFRLAVDRLL